MSMYRLSQMTLIGYNPSCELPPCGFNNLGNTCYFNALMQSLLSCTSLNQILLTNKTKQQYAENRVASAYIDMLIRLYNKQDASGMSVQIWREFMAFMRSTGEYAKFRNGQQDACEGFYLFMHSLNPEKSYEHYKLYELDKLFRHRYESAIHCGLCDEIVSKKTDEYIMFELEPSLVLESIRKGQYSVETAIEEYLLERVARLDESYICPKCERPGQKHKITSLVMAPEILIVLSKNYDLRRMSKHNITLPYPQQIEFRHDTDRYMLYEAVAQIEHSGTMSSGHYWARCKRKNGWYLLNDTSYRPSRFEPTQHTYMVFYHYAGLRSRPDQTSS
jgi:ubiquitin C-terminal hydrolase